MTTKEYIEHQRDDNYKEERKEYNKQLCKKYPWLIPTNKWSGKKITDCAGEDGEDGFWPGSPDSHPDFDWDHTELDAMPDGWRIAFGDEMCEELQKELEKFNYVNKFCILQIKEKYGTLRFYTGATPIGKISEDYEVFTKLKGESLPNDRDRYVYTYISTDGDTETYHKAEILEHCNIYKIIDKYEDMSERICIRCGKPAEYMTIGWISPYCADCAKNVKYDKVVTIEEFFKDEDDNE